MYIIKFNTTWIDYFPLCIKNKQDNYELHLHSLII